MFRPMRRKNKELSRELTEALLAGERRGVLALHGEDGYPYAVPINYLYSGDENCIYFHGARAGYKYELLKKCEQVCFTVCGGERIGDEDWAPFVRSAVVFGRCRAVEEPEENLRLVRRFAEKYYPDAALMEGEITAFGRAVQMFRIEIEHLSGKEIQEK